MMQTPGLEPGLPTRLSVTYGERLTTHGISLPDVGNLHDEDLNRFLGLLTTPSPSEGVCRWYLYQSESSISRRAARAANQAAIRAAW